MSIQSPSITKQYFSSLPFYTRLGSTQKTASSLNEFKFSISAFFYLLISLLLACISNTAADRMNLNSFLSPNEQISLPDPILNFLSFYFKKSGLPFILPEIFLALCMISMLIQLFILTPYATISRQFRRMCFIIGILYIFRSVCVVITVLPNPLSECRPAIQDGISFWENVWQVVTVQRTTCGDVFFSGHTIVYTMSILVLNNTASGSYMKHLFSFMVQIFAYGGMISLIAARYHYTLDVLFGYLITRCFYSGYQLLIKVKYFRKKWLIAQWLVWFESAGKQGKVVKRQTTEMSSSSSETEESSDERII